MSRRILQLNSLIQQELAKLLTEKIDLPNNCIATITQVDTEKNLRHAKIWVSVLPFIYTRKIIDKLNKSSKYLQFLLYKKLTLNPLPKIHFAADITEQKASEIEKILDEIKKKG